MLKNWLRSAVPKPPAPIADFDPLADIGQEERAIYARVQPYTMTSIERVANVVASIDYLCRNHIEGDIVECGVWRGGSMHAVARTLLSCGVTDRAASSSM